MPDLVNQISDIEGLEWIKLHYLYPNNFPLEILDIMKNKSNVCQYLDIPLQHISNNMLEKMRRNFTKEQSYDLVRRIRDKVPEISLRTTFMTGFPGETDKDFKQLIDFVQEMRFERMGVFTYSHEEDTFAYKNYKDAIPVKIKNERAEILMELQRNISFELNTRRIGQKMRVIIDEEKDGKYIGRTAYDSPEVDGIVLIDSAKKIKVGNFYTVTINSADEYDLYASI